MQNNGTTLFLLLILVFYSKAFADELDLKFSEWGLSPYPITEITKRKERRLNPSIKWQRHILHIENGELKLQIDDNYRHGAQISIFGIQYKGTDNGEFGGELGYTYNGKYIKLMDGNIIDLIPRGKMLYIFEGLDHMTSRGSVYVIRDASSPTKPERITLLPEEPLAATISRKGVIFIVSSSGVVSMPSDNVLNIIYWNAFWSGVFQWGGPTSIVVYKENILIGLPHGIAVIESEMYREQKIKLYMKPNLMRK